MIEVAFLLFSLAVAVTFFVSSLVLMNLGRRLGARYLVREGTPTVPGLNTVEGAVFALMGLVLAFAISGALQRFDERKQLILQEINAISTAYNRLDLLENPARLELKSADNRRRRARFTARSLTDLDVERVMDDGCARVCHPSPKGPGIPTRCCVAADPSEVPSTDTLSRAGKR